eukprot:269624-Chlamydomonas_euryale.AAC.1
MADEPEPSLEHLTNCPSRRRRLACQRLTYSAALPPKKSDLAPCPVQLPASCPPDLPPSPSLVGARHAHTLPPPLSYGS